MADIDCTVPSKKSGEMKEDTLAYIVAGGIICLILTIIAVVISFWVGVGYVIWHFITKFW